MKRGVAVLAIVVACGPAKPANRDPKPPSVSKPTDAVVATPS
jgi:hypothetical protein